MGGLLDGWAKGRQEGEGRGIGKRAWAMGTCGQVGDVGRLARWACKFVNGSKALGSACAVWAGGCASGTGSGWLDISLTNILAEPDLYGTDLGGRIDDRMHAWARACKKTPPCVCVCVQSVHFRFCNSSRHSTALVYREASWRSRAAS